MKINHNIQNIENILKDPSKGLPENVFLFLSRITPLINVDLLIKNVENQTLLTWRQPGEVYSSGWHFPGGIIRYKEKIIERIQEVAKNELKNKVVFDNKPIAINEVMLNQKNRGHFVSLLYSCKLVEKLDNIFRYTEGIPKVGQWSWHDSCPKNLIKPHTIYKDYF